MMRGRRGGRSIAVVRGLSLALLLAPAWPAGAQMGALPPEAAAEIRAALESPVAEAALADAVVGSIARDPGAVSAIVGAAVEAAPQFREAIVSRAGTAFPGFAARIAAAAGLPAPRPAAPAAASAPPAAPAAPVSRRSRTAVSRDSEREWTVELGIGVGVVPEYPGADEHEAVALPLVEIRWGDLLFLSATEGFGFNFARGRNLRLGVALTYNEGRDEDDNDRLRGLGDVEDTIEFGGFAEYAFLDSFTARAGIRQDIFGEHEGALVDVGLGYRARLGEGLDVALGGGARWASDDYMRSFFGVSSAQSARSRFAAFRADLGFLDVGLGGTLTYDLTARWFARGTAGLAVLLGDAADSPISDSDTQFSAGLALGYRY